MFEYQKQQLNLAMKELGTNSFQIGDVIQSDTGREDGKRNNRNIKKGCVEQLETKLMNIRTMRPND